MHRAICVSLALLAVAGSKAQSSLSLDSALDLAKQKNGTIVAAMKRVEVARARLKQSQGAFLPTLTPSFSYTDRRNELNTGVSNPPFTTLNSAATSEVTASWRLLDSGERGFALESSRLAYQAEVNDSLQTLRSTLVDVLIQYFEVIRAQELVGVAESQMARAAKTLEATKARIREGDLPEKDVYQPEADFYNAKVQVLGNRNRLKSAEADLKASIGWSSADPLPELERFARPSAIAVENLDLYMAEGMRGRPDLLAQRLRVKQQRTSLSQSKLLAGITYTLDLSYTKTFGPDNNNNRLLTFLASVPLFDGGRSKEAVRESQASLQASEASFEQFERSTRAQIEANYNNLTLTGEQLEAANLAFIAAKTNDEKTQRAFELGAAGVTVVTVAVAQATLTQAEAALVEAIYDFYVAQNRLDLAVGRSVRGER